MTQTETLTSPRPSPQNQPPPDHRTFLQSLSPGRVATYLADHGWHRVEGQTGVFTWGDDYEASVPLDPTFRDYAIRMSEVVQVIAAADKRSVSEVLSELAGCRCPKPVSSQLVTMAGDTCGHETFEQPVDCTLCGECLQNCSCLCPPEPTVACREIAA